MNPVYKQLREKLHKLPIGMPETDDAYEILRTIYTEDEAELALKIPVMDTDLEGIAGKTGWEAGKLKDKLDHMARKGTVLKYTVDGKTMYRLLPSMVGFIETPFWPGKVDDRVRSLSPVWRRYFNEKYAHEIGDRGQALTRVIPLNIPVKDESQITPFEYLPELLKSVDYFAVGYCPCRMIARQTGNGCDHSIDNCLHFGSMGRYMVDHGMGREVSREEVVQILRKANKEGLVHITDNHQGHIETVCNCCSHACIWLRARRDIKLPNAFKRSNYVAAVETDLCTGCETCADRCPVDAITVTDASTVDREQCIGCGVCSPTCPGEAIALQRRPAAEIDAIPTRRKYAVNMIREKQSN